MVSKFNKKKEYKDEVYPIIEELYGKCAELKLPMFVAVCVANDENKSQYEYETLLAALQLDLKDNQIAKMLFSFNGFETKLPEDVRNAIQVLKKYAERIKDKKVLDIELTDEQITNFVKIANYADVDFSHGVVGNNTVLDDDFFK